MLDDKYNLCFKASWLDTVVIPRNGKIYFYTQRAKYSGERYLWGRCLADSLNLSTESRLQCNRVNDTEKSARISLLWYSLSKEE